MADCDRSQRRVHRKLRFQRMAEIGAGGAYGNVRVLGQECAFLGRRGSRAAGA
jgi:hypothetical protein